MNQAILNRSRNDKFIMILDLPIAMKKLHDSVLNDNFRIDPLQFSIFGSPVPSINVPEKEIAYGGQVIKTSSFSRPAYAPLSVKFLVDNGYKNYWILWKWLNLFNDSLKSTSDANIAINTPIGNKTPVIKNDLSDFTSNFYIHPMDEFNNKIMSFKYMGAFPTSLSEINFSNQDASEISCTVTFAFSRLDVDLTKNVDTVSC